MNKKVNVDVVTFVSVALGLFMVTIVVGLLLSLPVMLLWNGCLVPAVNGVNQIDWLQAWGLMVLFGVLFKTSVSTKSS